MKSRIWSLILIVGLVLGAMAQNWLDAQGRSSAGIDETLYFTSGETLKHADLGFNGLLADLYWIRTIQYFGGKLEQQRATREQIDLREMRLLEPLLEITTDLDPHLMAAYRFGAFFLPDIDPERAINFTKRGILNNPNDWRLYQDLGFTYWRLGRYREASEAYLSGSRLTGSPNWMQAMAATMLIKGGDRATAREMSQRLCEGTDDQFIKRLCDEQSDPPKSQ